MRRCIKITVFGKVQGVGYREFVAKNAKSLAIEGTIQNALEGNVIIYACGGANNLDEFIDLLYQGSPSSKVQNIIAEPHIPEKDFRGVFRIIGVE